MNLLALLWPEQHAQGALVGALLNRAQWGSELWRSSSSDDDLRALRHCRARQDLDSAAVGSLCWVPGSAHTAVGSEGLQLSSALLWANWSLPGQCSGSACWWEISPGRKLAVVSWLLSDAQPLVSQGNTASVVWLKFSGFLIFLVFLLLHWCYPDTGNKYCAFYGPNTKVRAISAEKLAVLLPRYEEGRIGGGRIYKVIWES